MLFHVGFLSLSTFLPFQFLWYCTVLSRLILMNALFMLLLFPLTPLLTYTVVDPKTSIWVFLSMVCFALIIWKTEGAIYLPLRKSHHCDLKRKALRLYHQEDTWYKRGNTVCATCQLVVMIKHLPLIKASSWNQNPWKITNIYKSTFNSHTFLGK